MIHTKTVHARANSSDRRAIGVPIRRMVLRSTARYVRRASGSTTARMKQYSFEAASTAAGKPGCTVQASTGHTLEMDLPKAVGGADRGPQPVELLVSSLLGCKTATAHFVARHLWQRPHNRIDHIEFSQVVAERDERGALTLPIGTLPPVTSALLSVRGIATVTPAARAQGVITHEQVDELGHLVEVRCPVAATLKAAGVDVDFEWRLGGRGEEE